MVFEFCVVVKYLFSCCSSECIILLTVFYVQKDAKGCANSVVVCPNKHVSLYFPYFLFLCFFYSCYVLSGRLKYVPPCDLNGCSKWNLSGWTEIEPDDIETSPSSSGKLWCYCACIMFNYSLSLRKFSHEYCIM